MTPGPARGRLRQLQSAPHSPSTPVMQGQIPIGCSKKRLERKQSSLSKKLLHTGVVARKYRKALVCLDIAELLTYHPCQGAL